MRQPKAVIVLEGSEKTRYNLPNTPIECIIQNRDLTDESKIVYVINPKYIKGSNEESPYIALTKTEYEVVEWTN